MNPIRRQMKKRNPSSGQNGQLVHWWLLIHSGPSDGSWDSKGDENDLKNLSSFNAKSLLGCQLMTQHEKIGKKNTGTC
jgi:hypothetical protein